MKLVKVWSESPVSLQTSEWQMKEHLITDTRDLQLDGTERRRARERLGERLGSCVWLCRTAGLSVESHSDLRTSVQVIFHPKINWKIFGIVASSWKLNTIKFYYLNASNCNLHNAKVKYSRTMIVTFKIKSPKWNLHNAKLNYSKILII